MVAKYQKTYTFCEDTFLCGTFIRLLCELQLVRSFIFDHVKCPIFYRTRRWFQQTATGPYAEAHESTKNFLFYFLMLILMLSSHLPVGANVVSVLFSSDLHTKTLYIGLFAFMHATYPTHLTFTDFIIPIIFHEYKLLSFSLFY
jgi:hypothetical protein